MTLDGLRSQFRCSGHVLNVVVVDYLYHSGMLGGQEIPDDVEFVVYDVAAGFADWFDDMSLGERFASALKDHGYELHDDGELGYVGNIDVRRRERQQPKMGGRA